MSLRSLFKRTPGAGSNHEAEHNALWLHSLNRFKAMTEGEHQRREREGEDS